MPIPPFSHTFDQIRDLGGRQWVLIDFGCICAERNIYVALQIKFSSSSGGINKCSQDWAQNTSTR